MSSDDKFNELLDYELQNRAFAVEYTKKSSNSWKDKNIADFWKAYYQYEVSVRYLYQEYANKLNMSTEKSRYTSTKIWTAHFASKVAPNYMLDKIHELTVNYVEDLKELERLSPQEHAKFFRFVVEQEEMQVRALGLVVDGRVKEATNTLIEFRESLPEHL